MTIDDEASASYEALAAVAVEAAGRGAQLLAELAPNRDGISVKGVTGNLVTEVDVAAENVIRDVIASARPSDRITGEELPDQGAADAAVTWSIDPLDGTMNYVRGIPYFASSVAAHDDARRRWVAGAVVAPGLGRTYWASRGAGSYLRYEGPGAASRRTRRLTGPPPGDLGALLGTGFSYDAAIRGEQYRRLPGVMESFVDLRRFGSAALEICAVADGTIDAYYEDDLGVYDWAAAMLIAEEAGLAVRRPDDASPVAAVNWGQARR